MNGEDIRMIRGVMGDTIAEFSARIGVSRSHLQAAETGGREISPALHVKILRVIDGPQYQEKLRRIHAIPEETRSILRGWGIWE